MNNELNTIDGQTLLNTPMEAPRFVVSSLIPSGLCILGGAPKMGKSWLTLWLCLQIATGENVWNYQTKRGTVLYLCLEDSFERIQSRLLDITDDAPDNLFFAIMAGNIDSGLVAQIEAFLTRHPDTVLIAIDTLQKIRGDGNNSNPYANDYRELTVLRDLAYKHKLTILCVHHLRKMKDEDPMNMLSGTNGLAGVADTVFILDKKKRSDRDAKLTCEGRDIEPVTLRLELDKDTHVWNLCGGNTGVEIPLLDDVVLCLCTCLGFLPCGFTGTATELASEVERTTGRAIHPVALRKKLMRHYGTLLEMGWQCSFRRTRNEKMIEIRRRESAAIN